MQFTSPSFLKIASSLSTQLDGFMLALSQDRQMLLNMQRSLNEEYENISSISSFPHSQHAHPQTTDKYDIMMNYLKTELSGHV